MNAPQSGVHAPEPPGPPPEIDDRETALALCNSLKATADRLGGLIARESELLAAGALGGIDGLREEKAELATAYLAAMSRLKRNAAAVKRLAPEAAAELQPMLKQLGARLVSNQNALAAVLAVTERLIRTAALKAVAAERGPGAYGADARLDGPRETLPAGTVSRRA